MRSNETTGDGYEGKHWRRMWIALALCIATTTGCTATIRTSRAIGGYDVVAVDGVPYDLGMYPRYYYQDRYAYLIDGSWYYPTNQGWVMFVEEPQPLLEYRLQVQSAPPATRKPDVYYSYPPQRPPPTPPRELHREYRP